MRFKTVSVQNQNLGRYNRFDHEPKRPNKWRQFALGAAVLGLTACSSFGADDDPEAGRGRIGYIKGFIGGVAADEPRAVLIGRDVLSAGGTAADAAVAVYFALSVTLPSSASLGGGGVCLVRNQKENTVETLDFQALASKRPAPSGRVPVAVPGNPLGFYSLHTKYGKLKWAELIRPAENLARFGNQVSRAFGNDLSLAGEKLLRHPDSTTVFTAPTHQGLIREGDFFKQAELSGMLARIRSVGGAKFYSGPSGRDFIAAVDAVGGYLEYDDLRSFRPNWRSTVTVSWIKETRFHFPSPPGNSGAIAAQLTAILGYDDLYEDGNAELRAHLIAEATERALADQGNWTGSNSAKLIDSQFVLPERAEQLMQNFRKDQRVVTSGARPAKLDPMSQSASASFSVMDNEGGAVTCSLSMNKPFGAGRVARGTGIVLAAPQDPSNGAMSLSSVMLVSKIRKAIYYASSSSGGALAPTSLVNVAVNALTDENSTLESAINLKRVHHGGADGITYIETESPKAVVDGLTRRGHKVAHVNSMGVVNAVLCVNGIPHENIDCSAFNDPRASGLALSTQ
jgi:gamma-glutamyltranspeptidase/glutathione hydrolase